MLMKKQSILIAGALLGGLAVGLGAFGAHALKNLLLENGRTDTYELAVRYHFYHALALLLIGTLAQENNKRFSYASLFILTGVVLFSGSLYLFALTNITTFAMVTPIGGLLLLGGWITFAIALARKIQ
ncbi:MAG: DUF423 domain-containing protein [Bacteroidetes bacterium]|nr:DUF423 domain-containing protein [Bacteroidota bacterium]MBS1541455.1 DUF423 domain-containing protein [Bacteroidota bacterium]